jgi:hypothetical protein
VSTALQNTILMELLFHILQQFYCFPGLKILGHGNPDNNVESHCNLFDENLYSTLVCLRVENVVACIAVAMQRS